MLLSKVFPTFRQISKFRLANFPYVGTQTTNDLPRNAEGKLVVQGEGWHTDHSNMARPPRFSALSGFLCPKKGGQTPFIDTVGAYQALPEEWKRKLSGVRAFHQYAAPARSKTVRATPGKNDVIEESVRN
jgi:taurine dioxygenase